MNDNFRPQPGAVLSADIAVPEHERAVRFYSRVLSTGERPLWRDGTLLNNVGVPVIGLGALTPEYAELPLQWMPHIQVAGVGAGVERALELGGRVLIRAEGEDEGSHWAVLLDPNGAAFGIVPVVAAEHVPQALDASNAGQAVGRIVWLDLTVADASATRDFYRHVVGWTVQDVAMQDDDTAYADYNMLNAGGDPAAGICHARGTNAGLPPVWMIYLPVGDIAESIRRADEDGGRVIRTVRDRSGEYAYAVIQDPAGAYLTLVQE